MNARAMVAGDSGDFSLGRRIIEDNGKAAVF